jgi:hypothetical protein
MDANTEKMLLNTALKVAYDATGLIPGLAEIHSALAIANDVAPAVEAAVEYFSSDEGQRAVAHLRAIFEAFPHAEGAKPVYSKPHYPGHHLEWDALRGYVWAKD